MKSIKVSFQENSTKATLLITPFSMLRFVELLNVCIILRHACLTSYLNNDLASLNECIDLFIVERIKSNVNIIEKLCFKCNYKLTVARVD